MVLFLLQMKSFSFNVIQAHQNIIIPIYITNSNLVHCLNLFIRIKFVLFDPNQNHFKTKPIPTQNLNLQQEFIAILTVY